MGEFYSWKEDSLLLQVYLQPRASSNRIIGIHAEYLKIALTAAPVDNKANECLIEFLAKFFAIKKSAISIVKGQTNRKKLICIQADSCRNEIFAKLEAICSNIKFHN